MKNKAIDEMNLEKEIEEAAIELYKIQDYSDEDSSELQNAFIEGAKSEAAKEYWLQQFLPVIPIIRGPKVYGEEEMTYKLLLLAKTMVGMDIDGQEDQVIYYEKKLKEIRTK